MRLAIREALRMTLRLSDAARLKLFAPVGGTIWARRQRDMASHGARIQLNERKGALDFQTSHRVSQPSLLLAAGASVTRPIACHPASLPASPSVEPERGGGRASSTA